jgi:oligopeptide transport system substrate-binding protein
MNTKIAFIFSFAILILTMSSCTGKRGKTFEHAGGTFAIAILHEPTTLNARDVTDLYSAIVIYQVLEGLVALDPKTLEPVPALADSWKVSDDGLTIEFLIKDDVVFHDNDLTGSNRKLVPDDIVYSIELACTKRMGEEPSSAYSSIYKGNIQGVESFFDGEVSSISGLTVDGQKLIIELQKPDVSFVDKLASATASVVLKEAVEAGRETDLIGTGPFVFKHYRERDDNTEIVMVRNENYHMLDEHGNMLPYLDSLIYIVESKSLAQLEMFEEGKILLIEGLPPSRITSMLEGRMSDFNSTPPELILRRKPVLATQFYEFNLLHEPFQDKRVRQALNYAVDRDEIIQKVLNNQAHSAGIAGIVPPAAFSGYKSSEVQKHGYTFNPEKARKLLNDAGYPNGEGFPTIELKFNIGTIHSAVADQFARQMKKNLNINVNLDGLSFEDKIADQQRGNGMLFRTSWFADYYSPETFLMNMYGKVVPEHAEEPSLINMSRYQNEDFDRLFEAGQASRDISERYRNFMEAEKIMIQDAPIIPLWYEETIKIHYSKVRNLGLNEMNYYQFKHVYLKDWTNEEFLASQKESN